MITELFKEISNENPTKTIAGVEKKENDVIITVLIDNEYYELCQININSSKINVNKFLIIYEGFTVNKDNLLKIINESKKKESQ